eukprot:CAMPEP_0177643092 /NCGR_PEP_ID=MMETSP0447-20121125/7970_1 /TAXON_ID=0 /ORGANISM="Stygamoeba regulata, Strain BSH-02190019" /LENGTH=338 /DNA_ID=CAMNT_0019145363 /DNA_START=149 /DNA_END=1162 /DNA_ORIENTATION=-
MHPVALPEARVLAAFVQQGALPLLFVVAPLTFVLVRLENHHAVAVALAVLPTAGVLGRVAVCLRALASALPSQPLPLVAGTVLRCVCAVPMAQVEFPVAIVRVASRINEDAFPVPPPVHEGAIVLPGLRCLHAVSMELVGLEIPDKGPAVCQLQRAAPLLVPTLQHALIHRAVPTGDEPKPVGHAVGPAALVGEARGGGQRAVPANEIIRKLALKHVIVWECDLPLTALLAMPKGTLEHSPFRCGQPALSMQLALMPLALGLLARRVFHAPLPLNDIVLPVARVNRPVCELECALPVHAPHEPLAAEFGVVTEHEVQLALAPLVCIAIGQADGARQLR